MNITLFPRALLLISTLCSLAAVVSAAEAGERLGKASTEGVELYNLREDIGEQKNVAPRHPEKLHELTAAWNKLNGEMVDAKWVPNRAAATKKAAAKKQKVGK